MADTLPQDNGFAQSQPAPKRTRRRVPVSCNLCHSRKLKCNRQKPCSSCEIRGEGSKCTYASRNPHEEPPAPRRRRLAHKDDELQQRLENLERMIVDAANTKTPSTSYPTPGATSDELSLTSPSSAPAKLEAQNAAIGSLDTRGPHATYAGDTAFHGILQELGELRSIYTESHDDYQQDGQDPGYSTSHRGLLGHSHHGPELSREALLEALPAKPMSDGLIARFFDNDDPAIPVIYLLHRNTFIQEYQRHCENSSNTSIAWLGLFYSIMSLSARFYECEMGSTPGYRAKAMEMSEGFYHNAAHCLDTVDMANPVPGTIEFVSMFLHTAYFRRQDNSAQIWLLTGDTVRLAMRMGYHRDPASYSHFSPFECEMRRRVWATVNQTDLLFSFQLGLPTVVKSNEFDTLRPGNFFEDQLYPELQVLPAEQPPDAPTFISYWIANDSLLRPFRSIVEEMNILTPTPYSHTLALGRQLTEARSLIAPHLRHETANPSSHNSAIVLKRIQLDQLYHKAMCVLHRKYMAEGLRDPEFRPSTDACIQSALALLRCQEELHSKEMTLFRQVRWHVFSLTNHDFVLAATILCLYLTLVDRSRLHALAMAAAQDGHPTSDRATIEEALTKSRVIWSEVQHTSEEARRAHDILETTLSRRESFLGSRTQTPAAPVAVDPAIAHMQGQNGFVDSSVAFDPDFDWDSWDSYFRDAELFQPNIA